MVSVQHVQILIINMDRSPDRLAFMKAQCAKAGLSFTRVPGLLADALPAELNRHVFGAETRPPTLKTGEIGCFAAHLSVFAGIAAGRYAPVALVLEDDCALPADLGAVIAALLRAAPGDWDLIRLTNKPKRAYLPVAHLPSGHQVIRYSKVPNCAGGYLVSLAGARKLLRSSVRDLPFDEFLRRPWLHGCSIYGLWPPLVEQLDLPSCIDTVEDRRAVKEARLTKLTRKANLGDLGRRMAWNARSLGPGRWLLCCLINGAAKLTRRRALVHVCSALLKPSQPQAAPQQSSLVETASGFRPKA